MFTVGWVSVAGGTLLLFTAHDTFRSTIGDLKGMSTAIFDDIDSVVAHDKR